MYNGRSIDLATLLGARTTNAAGEVTAAEAALMTFILQGGDSVSKLKHYLVIQVNSKA